MMTSPEGEGFPGPNDTVPPILAIQVGPDEDQPANNPTTQQYGFGWTARPFHPKYQGHTALKDFFIKRMRDDKIPGVKPGQQSVPPIGTPPGPDKNECRGLGKEGDRDKYVERKAIKDIIEGKDGWNRFCQAAVQAKGGVLEKRYLPNTPNEVVVRVSGELGVIDREDCVNKLLRGVVDGCDGNNKANIENVKGGGKLTAGKVVYEVEPVATRQPFNMPNKDASGARRCNPFLFRGKRFPSSAIMSFGERDGRHQTTGKNCAVNCSAVV